MPALSASRPTAESDTPFGMRRPLAAGVIAMPASPAVPSFSPEGVKMGPDEADLPLGTRTPQTTVVRDGTALFDVVTYRTVDAIEDFKLRVVLRKAVGSVSLPAIEATFRWQKKVAGPRWDYVSKKYIVIWAD
ncbi:hypothetical protein HK405_006426 [Cladochytrium tenue]|nr:hypothetical protein HK405_006426 [Cladochytrium tenue]